MDRNVFISVNLVVHLKTMTRDFNQFHINVKWNDVDKGRKFSLSAFGLLLSLITIKLNISQKQKNLLKPTNWRQRDKRIKVLSVSILMNVEWSDEKNSIYLFSRKLALTEIRSKCFLQFGKICALSNVNFWFSCKLMLKRLFEAKFHTKIWKKLQQTIFEVSKKI